MTRILVLVSALALLASCGTRRESIGEAFDILRQSLPSEQQEIRQTITPEALETFGQPFMFAKMLDSGAEVALFFYRGYDDVEHWTTARGNTVTFRDGVLLQTRGLGDDLMIADLGEVLPAIRGGGGQAVRVHRYLDGEEHLQIRSFVCDYAFVPSSAAETLVGVFPASLVVEDCASPKGDIENRYWIDRSGKIRKSQQWISDEVGYIYTELLRDR